MLYTWNEYTIVHQLYLNLKKKHTYLTIYHLQLFEMLISFFIHLGALIWFLK